MPETDYKAAFEELAEEIVERVPMYPPHWKSIVDRIIERHTTISDADLPQEGFWFYFDPVQWDEGWHIGQWQDGSLVQIMWCGPGVGQLGNPSLDCANERRHTFTIGERIVIPEEPMGFEATPNDGRKVVEEVK